MSPLENCKRKKSFSTKAKAKKYMLHANATGAILRRAYRCKICGDYHLTSWSRHMDTEDIQKVEIRKHKKSII